MLFSPTGSPSHPGATSVSPSAALSTGKLADARPGYTDTPVSAPRPLSAVGNPLNALGSPYRVIASALGPPSGALAAPPGVNLVAPPSSQVGVLPRPRLPAGSSLQTRPWGAPTGRPVKLAVPELTPPHAPGEGGRWAPMRGRVRACWTQRCRCEGHVPATCLVASRGAQRPLPRRCRTAIRPHPPRVRKARGRLFSRVAERTGGLCLAGRAPARLGARLLLAPPAQGAAAACGRLPPRVSRRVPRPSGLGTAQSCGLAPALAAPRPKGSARGAHGHSRFRGPGRGFVGGAVRGSGICERMERIGAAAGPVGEAARRARVIAVR